jgi:hypothetical protein
VTFYAYKSLIFNFIVPDQESNFKANKATILAAKRIFASLKSICFIDTLINTVIDKKCTPTALAGNIV